VKILQLRMVAVARMLLRHRKIPGVAVAVEESSLMNRWYQIRIVLDLSLLMHFLKNLKNLLI